MANNVAVSITADVADLTAKMAIAQVTMKDVGKSMRDVARQVASGDVSAETKTQLLQLADAYSQASNASVSYARQVKANRVVETEAVVSSGQMKFALRDLSYQVNDISTMWAMGAKPMQIFASQSGQVIQALSLMAGEAKGVLGFLGGPWGMIMTSAAVALAPLIGKLFETGETAAESARKVDDFADAIARLRSTPMEAIGKLQSNVFTAQGKLNAAQAMPRYEGGGSDEYKKNTFRERERRRAIGEAQVELQNAQAELKVAQATAKTNETLFEIRAKAGRSRARDIKADDDKPSRKSANRSGHAAANKAAQEAARAQKEAARAAEEAARDELQERISVNRQEGALAEEQSRTEIDLSQITLNAKLDDIQAEQRMGRITAKQAIQQRAAVNEKLLQLDGDLETRLHASKLLELRKNRENYAEQTKEYRDYTRQIELLNRQHQNRMALIQAQAKAKQAQSADDEIIRQRQMAGQIAQPFAQQFAKLATLQQGFLATMRGMWGSLVGFAEQAISRIVTNWIIGLATQDAASEKMHLKQVFRDAKQAASGAWKAVVGIPIVGPILAPIAAAAAFAGVMAFSAKDGFDVPDLGGPGIDGRGGQLGIVHPREMVLPAQLADVVRGGVANAGAWQAPVEQARASMMHANANLRPGADRDLAPFRVEIPGRSRSSMGDDGGFGFGGSANRNNRRGGAVGDSPSITIKAMDAKSFERFAKRNKSGLAKAARSYARNNGR